MNKKALVLSLLWVLLLTGLMQGVSAVSIPNQGHYIVESIGDPETVDPAWAYDTASAGLIFNVYDTLLFFDREHMDVFKPSVASSWAIMQPPHSAAPAETNNTWYFEIEDGIYFAPWKDETDTWHAPKLLTSYDVEYSMERWCVQDRSGGPTWMINEPLFELFHVDPSWPSDASNPINQRIQANDTHVWFNFKMFYPELVIKQVLCQSWASIVNKDFCVHYNDWPQTWNNWLDYHDPGLSPLDAAGNVMCGSGPFMLDYWIHGVEYSIIAYKKNNPERTDPYAATYEHHGGWPDAHASRSLDRATEKVVYEWGTRLADFRAGTADSVYVPRAFIAQVEGWPGIRGLKDIPALIMDACFYNFDINPASGYIGTGEFDQDGNGVPDGIPTDFFDDARIRQAWSYCFNFTKFLDEVWLGEAVQASSPVIEGLAYHNPDNPKYAMDLTKAAQLFQAASADSTSPAKDVWTKGFYVKLTYNTGNVPRQVTAEMFRDNLKKVNAKFNVEILGVTWPTYLYEIWFYPTFQSVLPVFIIGWLADYPDPHNWVTPYMHTYGDFSYPQRYSNATVDELIGIGIRTPDLPWTVLMTLENTSDIGIGHSSPVCSTWEDPNDPWDDEWHVKEWIDSDGNGEISDCDHLHMNCTQCNHPGGGHQGKQMWMHTNKITHTSTTYEMEVEYNRKWIYYALQVLYYYDVPSLPQEQALGRRWERDWVQGWYSNSIYPGAYYYERWKGLNGDISGDNAVNSLDVGKVNYFWWLPPVAGIAGYYDPIADINPELQKVLDMLPAGWPSIGEVDVMDLALINVHWLETVP